MDTDSAHLSDVRKTDDRVFRDSEKDDFNGLYPMEVDCSGASSGKGAILRHGEGILAQKLKYYAEKHKDF